MVILAKFHDVWSKIVDCLPRDNFEPCPIFDMSQCHTIVKIFIHFSFAIAFNFEQKSCKPTTVRNLFVKYENFGI